MGQRATESASPAKGQASSGKQAGRPWHITFDELVHNDATGEGEATMVVATSEEDTVIRADRFRWNDKTKTAQATGHLQMSDDQSEGTAEKVDIQYAREKRLMILTGKVALTLKPRNDGAARTSGKPAAGGDGGASSTATQAPPGSATPDSGASASARSDDEARLRDYPIEVTCDRVEYEYARDKRHAVLTGGFRAVQKLKDYTRTLTAEQAEWFGREERVVLKGPVKLEDTKGRKGESPEDVTVFTREGKEGIRLRKGTYTMPVEEEGAAPPAQPPDRQTPPQGPERGPAQGGNGPERERSRGSGTGPV